MSDSLRYFAEFAMGLGAAIIVLFSWAAVLVVVFPNLFGIYSSKRRK